MIDAAGRVRRAPVVDVYRRARWRNLLWNIQDGNCARCGLPMVSEIPNDQDRKAMTLDMKTPGEPFVFRNLQGSHLWCSQQEDRETVPPWFWES